MLRRRRTGRIPAFGRSDCSGYNDLRPGHSWSILAAAASAELHPRGCCDTPASTIHPCPSDTTVTRLPYGKRPRRLPQVRSRQDVARLLAGVHSPVIAMLLRLIYATGLRCQAGRSTPREAQLFAGGIVDGADTIPQRETGTRRRQAGGLKPRFRSTARYPAARTCPADG